MEFNCLNATATSRRPFTFYHSVPGNSWYSFYRPNKKNLELVTSPSLSYKTSSKKFLYFILSDQVWWCNIERFSSYCKNHICKFMQANAWHHQLFHFHLFFRIWNNLKGRGENTNVWVSRERKELFRVDKKHFSQFLKGYHSLKK